MLQLKPMTIINTIFLMLMLQYQCYTFKKELDKEQSLQMCTCAYTVNTDITVCLQVTLGH